MEQSRPQEYQIRSYLVFHVLLELLLESADPPLQVLDLFGQERDGGGKLIFGSLSPVPQTPTPQNKHTKNQTLSLGPQHGWTNIRSCPV